MTEESRMLAHRVIYTLWHDMPQYDKGNVTPELAAYVFVVYERGSAVQSIIALHGSYCRKRFSAVSRLPARTELRLFKLAERRTVGSRRPHVSRT